MTSLEISDEHFHAVVALPGPKRYHYTVARVADFEELWGLRNARGWAAVADDAGRSYFPVWPARRFAEAFATGELGDNDAHRIELERWLNDLSDVLSKEASDVAVFPTPSDKMVGVSTERFTLDLRKELEQYE